MDRYISEAESLLQRFQGLDISTASNREESTLKKEFSGHSYVQTLIDSVEDPAVIIDLEYRILFANKKINEEEAKETLSLLEEIFSEIGLS